MAFSDNFSADSLAKLANDPLLTVGLSLLAGSGNGGPGQLGRAGLNGVQAVQANQQHQQLAQYRAQTIQQQQAELQARQQQAQAKADQQAQWQRAVQDPAFQAQLGPLARSLAGAGVPANLILQAQQAEAQRQMQQQQFDQSRANHADMQAYRAQQLALGQQNADARTASGGANPKPRQIIEEPLADGKIQKHIFNAQTGQYDPYGSPYSPYAPKAPTILDQLAGLAPTGPGADMADETAPANLPVMPKELGTPVAPAAQSAVPQAPPIAAHGSVLPTAAAPGSLKAAAAPAGDLDAAKAAIASGKSRQAVVNRLMQGGYTAEQIQAAGL